MLFFLCGAVILSFWGVLGDFGPFWAVLGCFGVSNGGNVNGWEDQLVRTYIDENSY